MVNRREKCLKGCDSGFFTGKGQDKLFEVSQSEFYVCVKCFEAIRVNICMVNRWSTVVYRRMIHSNGHLTLNGFISWHGSFTTVIIL